MSAASSVVFVVDDDASVRRALQRLLRAEGFRVEAFDSGPEFLQALAGGSRGCAVLDVKMPGMSGFDVLEHLAARGSRLPVILVTGHGDVPMAMRAKMVGCVSFLVKPFEDEAMIAAVRQALCRESAQGG